MILTPYHLGFKLPKPEKKDYIGSWEVKNGEWYDKQAYQQALDFYNFGTNPVEPEWISFEEREPEHNHRILGIKNGNVFEWGTYRKEQIGYIKANCDKWADAKTHSDRVEEWNKYQQRYEDWEVRKNGVFCHKDIVVRFDGDSVNIWGPTFHFDSDRPITCKLFEMIINE